jgi:hypothetical protein
MARYSVTPVPRKCRLMAHPINSRQRSASVAFGAKRTLTEPRVIESGFMSTRRGLPAHGDYRPPSIGSTYCTPQRSQCEQSLLQLGAARWLSRLGIAQWAA